MSDRCGYFGEILWVNLSTGKAEKETLPDNLYRDYIGGYGIGVRILFDRMPSHSNPLGPDNIIGFLPGLLTGTVAPFSGRYMVVGKSPLTGTWGDANSGGYFGPAIKYCGVDGIFVTGISEAPVYLLYDGRQPRLMDAAECWGLDASETEDYMRSMYGKATQVAVIGSAGEKISLISCVMTHKGRAAARCGLGAVMGSKKLKAVVLTGDVEVPIHDSNRLKTMAADYIKQMKRKPSWKTRLFQRILKVPSIVRRMPGEMKVEADLWVNVAGKYGTSFGNTLSAITGDSPVQNWKGIGYHDFTIDQAQQINGEHYLNYKKKSYGCAACPLRCGAILSVPAKGIQETHRPEYETSCMFGTMLLNSDLHSLIEANELCNRAGLDTISTGSTIAFAFECFEAGLITEADTGGLPLHWGDSEAVIRILRMMIEREGFGDILADGTKKAAEWIGREAGKYAMQYYGQEIPAHDPKYSNSLALTYISDPTPGRHTAADTDFYCMFEFDKFMKGVRLPKDRKNAQNRAITQKTIIALMQVFNSLGYCQFGMLAGPMPVYEIIEAVTGWKTDYEEIIKTGLRIHNLRHAFNLRDDINLMSGELPDRITGNPPQAKGPNKGVSLDIKEFKNEFCRLMDWDSKTSVPSNTLLKDLGLDFVIGQI
ncbi:MAG: aldehyde ferredoxin oxidoreductase family protein [Thermodesulfobacteriota bacterium]